MTPAPTGRTVRAALAALGLILFGQSGAAAGDDGRACYEIIGCPHEEMIRQEDLADFGCDTLYDVRNIIYKENGYCFSTSKAIERFGNDRCRFADPLRVPLNEIERRNIAIIRAAERQRACLP